MFEAIFKQDTKLLELIINKAYIAGDKKALKRLGLTLDDNGGIDSVEALDCCLDNFFETMAFLSMTITLIKKHKSEKVIAEANKFIEAELQTLESRCVKGCFHCCYIEANILKPEYARLKPYTQNRTTTGNKCIFLENDLCSVYDMRPMACRHHITIADPALCLIDQATNVTNVKAAIVLSACVLHYGIVPLSSLSVTRCLP